MPVEEPRFYILRILRNAAIAIVISGLAGCAVGLPYGVLRLRLQHQYSTAWEVAGNAVAHQFIAY